MPNHQGRLGSWGSRGSLIFSYICAVHLLTEGGRSTIWSLWPPRLRSMINSSHAPRSPSSPAAVAPAASEPLKSLTGPVRYHPLTPEAQLTLADRLSKAMTAVTDRSRVEEIRSVSQQLVRSGDREISLVKQLEDVLIKGLEDSSFAGPCETILCRSRLSADGIRALALSVEGGRNSSKHVALSLAAVKSPQAEIFVGDAADALFQAATKFFYHPYGCFVEERLEQHGLFIEARLRYTADRFRSEQNDECLTAFAQTALFLGRCLRPTIRCRAAEAELILETQGLMEPLLEGTLRGASGWYGVYLKAISCLKLETGQMAFLIRKLPREQLLPTVKQALAAHLMRDCMED